MVFFPQQYLDLEWAMVDTLTAIQGIGIAAENRLCCAGIKSCSDLAEASSQEIREILGYLAQGSDIERWIEQARELIGEHAL
jgi:predicted flap endonuclease-1-like 5' DNA nuclease